MLLSPGARPRRLGATSHCPATPSSCEVPLGAPPRKFGRATSGVHPVVYVRRGTSDIQTGSKTAKGVAEHWVSGAVEKMPWMTQRVSRCAVR